MSTAVLAAASCRQLVIDWNDGNRAAAGGIAFRRLFQHPKGSVVLPQGMDLEGTAAGSDAAAACRVTWTNGHYTDGPNGTGLDLLLSQPPQRFLEGCEVITLASNQFFAPTFRTRKADYNQGLAALARGSPPGAGGCGPSLPPYTRPTIFAEVSRHLLVPQPSIQANADAYVRSLRMGGAGGGGGGTRHSGHSPHQQQHFLIGVHLRAEFFGPRGANPEYHGLWKSKGIGDCVRKVINRTGLAPERFRVYVASDRLELREDARRDLGKLAAHDLGNLMSQGRAGAQSSFGAVRNGASVRVALTELLILAQSNAMLIYDQTSTFSSVAAAWAVGHHGQTHPRMGQEQQHESASLRASANRGGRSASGAGERHSSPWFGAWQIHSKPEHCKHRHDAEWDPAFDAPMRGVALQGPFA